MESNGANVLVGALKDILLRLNLSVANCRGQCSDGAANMGGIRTGVATQISKYRIRQNIRGGKLSRFSWIFAKYECFTIENFCS